MKPLLMLEYKLKLYNIVTAFNPIFYYSDTFYFTLNNNCVKSSGFKLYKLSVLLPDDGNRQPKHVAGHIVRIYAV
jgi:hypothetical protein